LNHFTHIPFSAYFNVVRKETKTTQLLDDDKFQQDVTFLKELGKKSESLTGYSLYMWWFPTKIQEVLEMLMSRKPLDADVSGLLSLIMVAGIDFDDDTFFEMQVIQKAFLPKSNVQVGMNGRGVLYSTGYQVKSQQKEERHAFEKVSNVLCKVIRKQVSLKKYL
jgi:hypothetical protein